MEYICRVWGKQIKIIGWFLEMEKKKKSPRRLKFNTVQTVVIGFFGVILGGGILLSLPICNQKPIEFIDALFTSVSSVPESVRYRRPVMQNPAFPLLRD